MYMVGKRVCKRLTELLKLLSFQHINSYLSRLHGAPTGNALAANEEEAAGLDAVLNHQYVALRRQGVVRRANSPSTEKNTY
jgi:hypothetical protein